MSISLPRIDSLGVGRKYFSTIAPILVLPVKGTFGFSDVKKFFVKKSSTSNCFSNNSDIDKTSTAIRETCHLYGWGTQNDPRGSGFKPRWEQATNLKTDPKNPRDIIYMNTPPRRKNNNDSFRGGYPAKGVRNWSGRNSRRDPNCDRTGSKQRFGGKCNYEGWIGKIDLSKSSADFKLNFHPMIHLANNQQSDTSIPTDVKEYEINTNNLQLRITNDQEMYNKNIRSHMAYEAPPWVGANKTNNQPNMMTEGTASVYLDTIYTSWFFPGFVKGIETLSDRNELRNYLTNFRNTELLTDDDDAKDYIANFSVLYAIISQFYNQIYQMGPYSNRSTFNNFTRESNVYLPDNLQIFKNNFITSNVTFYNSVLSTPLQNKIDGILQNILQFPKIIKKNNIYYMKLYFPSHISTAHIDPSGDWGLRVNNFFQTTDSGIKLKNPYKFSFSRLSPTNMNVLTSTTNITKSSPYNSIYFLGSGVGDTPDNRMGLTVNFECEISNFSVMSIAYMLLHNPEIDRSLICTKSRPFGLLPADGCITEDKTSLAIKEDLATFCVRDSVLTGFALSRNEMQKLFLNINSKFCTCYRNSVSPPDTQHPDKIGQCFSRSCDDELMRNTFNLNQESCEPNCGNACFLMNNSNPTQQPLNKADFNETRYFNICGERCKFQIGKAEPFNKKVLIMLSMLGLIVIFYLFILFKNRKYRVSSIVFMLSTFLIIYIPILLFLANFFSGFSLCNKLGQESICFRNQTFIDKLFNIQARKIPKEFCSDIFNCECFVDNDCGDKNQFECRSGTCIPRDGNGRETETVKTRNIKIFDIIVGMIFIVFVVLTFIQLRKHSRDKKTIRILYIIFELSIILGVSIYLGYSNLKLHKQTRFKKITK